MSKLRTVNSFQDFLDEDFAWRLKEIAEMKLAAKNPVRVSADTLIRAGIPLIYAHWEGFVKTAVEAYIRYVDCQGLRYEELANPFIVFGAKKHVYSLVESHKSKVNIAAVDFFATRRAETAQLVYKGAVQTRSNLSSAVFENALLSVGIDHTPYRPMKNFIDTRLVDQRNKIAHGRYLSVDVDGYREIADEVIALLRRVKTDIQNAASMKQYVRVPRV